jgi:Uma2 family endonuclease
MGRPSVCDDQIRPPSAAFDEWSWRHGLHSMAMAGVRYADVYEGLTMSNAPATQLLTADDLLALPDDGNRYELVGKLICMPPASFRSSVVAATVLRIVGNFVAQHSLGLCGGADGGLRLFAQPDTVRAPDVSFVRAERIPPGPLEAGYFPGAPDLAVEVLSPSDRYPEVQRKVQEYLDAGTPLVWVLDPESRSATVTHADGRSTYLDSDGILDGEDVLPGFRVALADVWA